MVEPDRHDAPQPDGVKRRRLSQYVVVGVVVPLVCSGAAALATALVPWFTKLPAKHPLPTVTVTITAAPTVAPHPMATVTRWIGIVAPGGPSVASVTGVTAIVGCIAAVVGAVAAVITLRTRQGKRAKADAGA
jgi:hypothetical protein